ncbi:MAG: hypothetical protein K8I60_22830 [Anaerolineae bacterium]|nr:hypothetical protein [Anaerolineae bacterium]
MIHSINNLPAALSRRIRFDGGLLLTLALCLFALWPLLYRPGLPNGTDVLYHVYRVAEMDRTWSHGVLIPQWAESFYTGYGAPLFHYYASLTYYLTSLLARVFALDAVNSLRALIVLAVLGSGSGMYTFARQRGGKAGGVLAALVYVYSPYILFTEPYARGAYPEFMALALFPWVMWAYDRLRRRGGAVAFVLAACLSGALIITHNLMALVLTGLLAAWTVRGWIGRGYRLLPFVAIGVGVGLMGYFWLPVMLEGSAVRLGNLTAVAQLDYKNFFVPLRDLLAASPRVDAGAINGLLHQLNLGVAQWVLALLGIGAVSVGFVQKRRAASDNIFISDAVLVDALFFVVMAGVMIFLVLPVSAFLWEATAPLAFLQFPWRFLGPIAFCLAALAGMNGLWLARLPGRMQAVILAGAVLAIIGLATPLFYVDEWEHETVDTSVAGYQAQELAGRQRATTFSNEYLPAEVYYEPDATPRLLADYADGYPVNKAHLETLPEGVTLDLIEHGPQHDHWRVTADADFTLEVLTYDFSGWTAEVDGQSVPITPSDQHGLITFPVPAGEHDVRLYLGMTSPRTAGVVVSLVALVLVGVSAWVIRRKQWTAADNAISPLDTLNRAGFLIGGVIALVFVVVYVRPGGAWVDSPPGEAQWAQDPVHYNLGDGIQFLGYDLSSRVFHPGDRLELTVYWYASQTPDYGYASFVHVSAGGPPVAQADLLNPAGRPTKEWTPDGFIRDPYQIDLPSELPPGEYQLLVGLYTCDTRPPGDCGNGDRLLVMDADGNPVGDAVPLGTIQVR